MKGFWPAAGQEGNFIYLSPFLASSRHCLQGWVGVSCCPVLHLRNLFFAHRMKEGREVHAMG